MEWLCVLIFFLRYFFFSRDLYLFLLIFFNLLIFIFNGHFVVLSVGIIDIALYKGGFFYRGVVNDDDFE